MGHGNLCKYDKDDYNFNFPTLLTWQSTCFKATLTKFKLKSHHLFYRINLNPIILLQGHMKIAALNIPKHEGRVSSRHSEESSHWALLDRKERALFIDLFMRKIKMITWASLRTLYNWRRGYSWSCTLMLTQKLEFLHKKIISLFLLFLLPTRQKVQKLRSQRGSSDSSLCSSTAPRHTGVWK